MANAYLNTLRAQVLLTGDVARDVTSLLNGLGYDRTLRHSRSVADRSAILATQFAVPEQAASTAAWLHDISVVIPNGDRLILAEDWGMRIVAAEREHPTLLHQRQSALLAQELFGVRDAGILQAVSCHTTLQAGAAVLAKVLFVADKLAWDQEGLPPYASEMEAALTHSLDHAALVYIRWLREQRSTLKAVHPWLIDAYQQLASATW